MTAASETHSRARLRQLIAYITLDSEHHLGAQEFDEWWLSLCSWPPNLFAVTAALLHESGRYREYREGENKNQEPSLPINEHCAALGEWMTALKEVQLVGDCCSSITAPLPALLLKWGDSARSSADLLS